MRAGEMGARCESAMPPELEIPVDPDAWEFRDSK